MDGPRRSDAEAGSDCPAEWILDTVETPVLVLDEESVIREANGAAERLVGLAREELIGRSWSEFAGSDATDAIVTEAGRAFAQSVHDRAMTPHRRVWQDVVAPDGTVIRTGSAVDAEALAALVAPDDSTQRELLEEAQRRVAEARKLRQASAVVLEALDLREAIRRILEQLEQVLPYDSASVQLLKGNELEIVGGRGWADPDAVLGKRFPIPGDNPNTEVVQRQTPVVLGNAPEAYGEFRKPPHDHIKSFLGVPFVVRGRVIGMLAIDGERRHQFTEGHIRVASAFADQVAIAIENARLYDEVEALSLTDPLTELHNRRGIDQFGRDELKRAQRFGHALSALMVDLDRFKPVNDTHGHGVGDEVLVEVARRYRHALREVDLIGRYGGEEFAVLLPETDRAEAERVAERLRTRVAERPIATDAGELTITVSIGVAAWQPEEMTDLDALLERADRALYAAKRAGRNLVLPAQAAH